MNKPATSGFTCPLCGQTKGPAAAVRGDVVHGPTAQLMLEEHPGWTQDQPVCRDCLNRYRSRYVENVLREDKGELTALEQEVVQSLREHELLSQNTNDEFDRAQTAGARVADRIASFGGSWSFILIFLSVLALWIGINAVHLFRHPFDPFPFILLNLVLSCVAAIQAPVIMMSQNRQEARDRLRAEHDYQVNLKAELEIRNLQSKLDQLLSRQWERLLEIQRIQTELLEELAERRRR